MEKRDLSSWHGQRVDEIKCQRALPGALSGGVSQCRLHLSEVVAMRKDAYREVEIDALALLLVLSALALLPLPIALVAAAVVFVGCRVDA